MSQLIDDVEQFITDDMSVLRELLHEVKGLSVVSALPAVEEVAVDTFTREQFEFEQ